MRPFTSAILVAAGSSTRMGLPFSKQFIPLSGVCAIEHTVRAFQQCDDIDEIVIVLRSEDMEMLDEIFDYSKVTSVVRGGDTRAQSVSNGVRAANSNAAFYAIHDGARPLITSEEISRVVTRGYETGAATLGTPLTDTVKVVGEDGVIVSTPDRASMRSVQTPQVFSREIYTRALDNARAHGLSFTDDCALVEAIGVPAVVVTGEYTNIKLTTRTDIAHAEAILSQRREQMP